MCIIFIYNLIVLIDCNSAFQNYAVFSYRLSLKLFSVLHCMPRPIAFTQDYIYVHHTRFRNLLLFFKNVGSYINPSLTYIYLTKQCLWQLTLRLQLYFYCCLHTGGLLFHAVSSSQSPCFKKSQKILECSSKFLEYC